MQGTARSARVFPSGGARAPRYRPKVVRVAQGWERSPNPCPPAPDPFRNGRKTYGCHLNTNVVSGGSFSFSDWLNPSCGMSSVMMPPPLPTPVPP